MKIEIRADRKAPAAFWVSADGKDISKDITKIEFKADANHRHPPIVTITFLPESVELSHESQIFIERAGETMNTGYKT